MSTLTIRLPDDTHARMTALARQRAMGINKLMEELLADRVHPLAPRVDDVDVSAAPRASTVG